MIISIIIFRHFPWRHKPLWTSFTATVFFLSRFHCRAKFTHWKRVKSSFNKFSFSFIIDLMQICLTRVHIASKQSHYKILNVEWKVNQLIMRKFISWKLSKAGEKWKSNRRNWHSWSFIEIRNLLFFNSLFFSICFY